MPKRSTPERRAELGFVLVEALVSLTLVGIAMLLTLQLLVVDARVQNRIRAQREVLEVSETVIEILRAEGLPTKSVTLETDQLNALLGRRVRPMTLWLEVTPHPEVSRLWNVRVETRYQAGREIQERALETRVWRPQ
ncbi:MAG: type II secretion system GspH family protein [Thermoanaerobaculia bacterium]|nr:type II secretion system GspH family protein [Thermoanaerobaculia bacterium]